MAMVLFSLGELFAHPTPRPHELVAAEIEFQHDLDAAEIAAAINHTETAIREVVSDASMICIEPDIRRV